MIPTVRNQPLFVKTGRMGLMWNMLTYITIETPSVYTCDSLKAYKSLEAYNYYVNGCIDNVRVLQITKLCHPHYMVTASVGHSLKL